jgi:hypothetical protein
MVPEVVLYEPVIGDASEIMRLDDTESVATETTTLELFAKSIPPAHEVKVMPGAIVPVTEPIGHFME